MSEINELKQLVKENLDRRGLLDRLKTEVKTEILSILSDDFKSGNNQNSTLSNENLLINDLIREYLDFNRYNCTSNILISETGQPKIIMNRKFLCDQLNVKESVNSKSVPLLYSLINYFTSRSDTKHLPEMVENNIMQKLSNIKIEPDRSSISESSTDTQNDVIPRVYSARDFLRERSSYSSSSNDRYDQ